MCSSKRKIKTKHDFFCLDTLLLVKAKTLCVEKPKFETAVLWWYIHCSDRVSTVSGLQLILSPAKVFEVDAVAFHSVQKEKQHYCDDYAGLYHQMCCS